MLTTPRFMSFVHRHMFLATVTNCVIAVADWMQSNHLQFNENKTKFMWCTTDRRQRRLPTVGPTVRSCSVTPKSVVRDLGVYIDSDLSMCSHVGRTVSRCFAVLRQLRTIRRQVPTALFQWLIIALFCHTQITVTAHCMVCLRPWPGVSSLYRMPPRGSFYLVFGVQSTPLLHSSASIGCVSLSAFSLN